MKSSNLKKRIEGSTRRRTGWRLTGRNLKKRIEGKTGLKFKVGVYIKRHMELLKALIKNDLPDSFDPQELLIAAIDLRRLWAVELALRRGANPNWFDWRNRNAEKFFREIDVKLPPETPLRRAARRCFPEAVELLLRHGADPNALDKDGNTSLHLAAASDCLPAVELLLKYGVNPDVKNSVGLTPMHFAKSVPIVLMLLKGGAKWVAKPHLLCQPGAEVLADYVDLRPYARYAICNVKLLKVLLQRGGFTDLELYELLQRAVEEDNVDATALLLDFATTSIVTPSVAANVKSVKMLRMLQSRGVKIDKDLLVEFVRRDDVKLVRYTLKYVPMPNYVLCFARSFKMLQSLIDLGAGTNVQCGGEPLISWLADYFGKLIYKRVAALLIKRGADPNAKGSDGYTALCNIVVKYRVEALETLLRLGADPNVECDGKTPLCIAMQKESREMVSLLLKHGANPNVECDGRTPLLIAAEKCDKDMAELLLRHGADPRKSPLVYHVAYDDVYRLLPPP